MNGGKSLYVIRFYVHSERNYLVRKVSKRTSRDFLWTVGKVFMLYGLRIVEKSLGSNAYIIKRKAAPS